MNSCAWAARAAASTSSSVAFFAAIGDIGAHRVGEKEALLEDHPDLAAQRSKRHFADVAPVDHHSPCGGVVNRDTKRAAVDFPLPLGPTIATFSPGAM